MLDSVEYFFSKTRREEKEKRERRAASLGLDDPLNSCSFGEAYARNVRELDATIARREKELISILKPESLIAKRDGWQKYYDWFNKTMNELRKKETWRASGEYLTYGAWLKMVERIGSIL